MILGIDMYQQYKNPTHVSDKGASNSSGAALLSIPFGIQFSYGRNNASVALEAGANISPLAFDVSEYKGLGAVSFPLMAKINFGALTGHSSNRLIGYSLGGGVQLNRTELFGLTDNYKELNRRFFSTYVCEVGFGGGVGGFNAIFYVKIGLNKEEAFSFNSGLVTKTNLFQTKSSPKKKSIQKS
jgi:hypothetical protein